jgi:hypothetical protein
MAVAVDINTLFNPSVVVLILFCAVDYFPSLKPSSDKRRIGGLATLICFIYVKNCFASGLPIKLGQF